MDWQSVDSDLNLIYWSAGNWWLSNKHIKEFVPRNAHQEVNRRLWLVFLGLLLDSLSLSLSSFVLPISLAGSSYQCRQSFKGHIKGGLKMREQVKLQSNQLGLLHRYRYNSTHVHRYKYIAMAAQHLLTLFVRCFFSYFPYCCSTRGNMQNAKHR